MDIHIIIPVHTLSEEQKPHLLRAVASLAGKPADPSVKIKACIVHPPQLTDTLSSLLKGAAAPKTTLVVNDGPTDFQSQVNWAAKSLPETCEWAGILEFDDEFAAGYFDQAKLWSQDQPDAQVLLPLVANTDGDGQFIDFTNQIAWSPSVAGVSEPGYPSIETVSEFPYFTLSGALVRRDVLADFPLKVNFPLAFDMEWMLRTLNAGISTLVIPRLGYSHAFNLPGSIYDTVRRTMEPAEVGFWYAKARTEYHFPEDRPLIGFAHQNLTADAK